MENDSYMIGRYIGKLHNMMRRSLFKDSSGLDCTAAELRILTLILRCSDPVYQKDIEEEFGIRVHALVTVRDIHEYLQTKPEYESLLPLMEDYMSRYCVF